MPNLVKLYTVHGAMLIDTAQLNRPSRIRLTIYNMRGIRKVDAARSENEKLKFAYGVHRDNLFASRELAEANMERIMADIRSHDYANQSIQKKETC